MPPSPPPSQSIATALIYLVEDDGGVREAIRTFLEANGRRVEAYPSAEAFLQAHHSGDKGCLLLDVRMPGMSGLELLQHLKAEVRSLPVIMITGHGDIQMAAQAVSAGAVDFLTKPISGKQLLAAIDRALEQAADLTTVSGG
ncbi:MAG: response regulator transcription factor [Rhodospirillaceae bacterium]